MNDAENGFANQEPARADADELAKRDCPDDQCQGLSPTDSTLPRDHRQERREHNYLSQRRLEQGDRGRGEEGRSKIDREPWEPGPHRGVQRAVHGLASHAGDPLHLPGVVIDRGAQQRFSQDHTYELSGFDHWQLGEVVVALKPRALLRGSIADHRRHDRRDEGAYRRAVLGQREVDDTHLAQELAVFVDREDVRELMPVVSLRPETVPGRRDQAVDIDGRELRNHEGPGSVRGMGEQPGVRQGLLHGLSHLLSPQGWKPSQRRQCLLRVNSAEHKREHLGAEPGAHAGGLDGIHLPQHPGHRGGGHDPDHSVSTRPRQPGHDDADVGRMQVADQVPGGVLSAGADQIADLAGDFPCYVQRNRLALLDPRMRAPCVLRQAVCVVHLPHLLVPRGGSQNGRVEQNQAGIQRPVTNR